MASQQHPSPTAGMPPHHVQHPSQPQANGHMPVGVPPKTTAQYAAQVNENTWFQIGAVCQLQNDEDGAIHAYQQCLRHNNWSVPAMQAISAILRNRDDFPGAVDYLKNILKIEPNNGDTWGSLGHCYLMMDDLQQAYSAYQQALYHLQDPKEPKLWYGIGILYDRYGSLEHAEEAFSQVMRMEPNFEKANEIYFRLGIIYKQQQKFAQSLECFKYIVTDPPRPLSEEDIWFQIGHVHEQQKEYENAKAAYLRVLDRDPTHAKVLQQLGWLHHQASQNFQSQEQAIEYLEKSVASDQNDAQSWYLLGRCYMSQQKYPKAYEAYQQAVYRDGRNPTFWCSIGVLYYQINQYRDALDAYSRAIRLNPNISEVWYDLGTLYESCNNQTADALDAYQRAADLDPSNVHIKARLQLLQNGQPTNGMPNQNSAPLPQDVHPQAYNPSGNGPPGPIGPQWGSGPPAQPQGPPAPANGEWNRPLAEVRNPPQMPPQQLNPYDQRDGMRPPAHAPPRPGSPPRQDPIRQYQEARPTPGPPRRNMSPSPKSHNVVPSLYQGPQSAPPHQPPPQSQLPPHQQPPQNRITNPNYGTAAHPSSVPPPPPPNISAGPNQGPPGGPYRMPSPAPEVRPIHDSGPRSPAGGYGAPPPPYPPPAAIAGGAPAPPSMVPDAARERDERTPSGPKRLREWEDDESDKRVRLGDPSRRPSPPDRMQSPPRRSPPDAEARRLEEQRRANEGYHPSEAAHHPQALPSMAAMQHGPPPPPPPPPPGLPQMGSDVPQPKEEPKNHHEPAARKMEVDEDYDDSASEKNNVKPPRSGRESPRGTSVANGVPPPPGAAEAKA